jgi:hypothetical protein
MSEKSFRPGGALLRPPLVLLFIATAVVYLWMALVTAPAFERASGARMLDSRVFGYTASDVIDLHARVRDNPEAAAIANNMHRTIDFVFPILLTLSVTTVASVGFGALAHLRGTVPGRSARLFAGALALPYLGFDLRENGMSRTLYSVKSLAGDPPPEIVAALPGITSWKFTSAGAAIVIAGLIWLAVIVRTRRITQ